MIEEPTTAAIELPAIWKRQIEAILADNDDAGQSKALRERVSNAWDSAGGLMTDCAGLCNYECSLNGG